MSPLAKQQYMVHHNTSAVFVKTREFFISQGGDRDPWGKSWKMVEAECLEQARRIGGRMFGITPTSIYGPCGDCTCSGERLKLPALEVHDPEQLPDSNISAAARDVLAERRRQIEKEGWTPDHDDEHLDGALAAAAGCYASTAAVVLERREQHSHSYGHAAGKWPWKQQWWKPTTPRRDLVKAGALILAEIERIDRNEGAADA